MNDLNAFSQIDHPAIVLGEMFVVISIFALWLTVRNRPAPLPQLVLMLCLATLANLTGRVTHAYWYTWSNVALFWLWGILNSVWVVSVLMQIAEKTGAGDAHGNPAILVAPVFAHRNKHLFWGMVSVLFLLGCTYVGSLYSDNLANTAKAVTGYAQGYVAAKNESEERDQRLLIEQEKLACDLKEKQRTDSLALRKIAVKDSLWRAYVIADRDRQLEAIRRLSRPRTNKRTVPAPATREAADAEPGPANPALSPDRVKTPPPVVKPKKKFLGIFGATDILPDTLASARGN